MSFFLKHKCLTCVFLTFFFFIFLIAWLFWNFSFKVSPFSSPTLGQNGKWELWSCCSIPVGWGQPTQGHRRAANRRRRVVDRRQWALCVGGGGAFGLKACFVGYVPHVSCNPLVCYVRWL